jgi:glycosyltransferase involved in cell wall biosynthesis/SAM-dependent methyltransferase
MLKENTIKILENLVSNLPEIYQPIIGHPELTNTTSRSCEDRFVHISSVYQSLEKQLNRPLRVLDLGCAQGYFSIGLAKLGATVHGIDYLDKNIAVCKALANENPEFNISFETGRIEQLLTKLVPDQYDLVLGLSVFHHIVHEHGLLEVQSMLTVLADKVEVAIFELALASEPLYWAVSQAQQPRQLLDGFAFVHELAEHETHLSDIKRPLYVASNTYWYLDGQLNSFQSWKMDSHDLAHGTHQSTRRYFFGNGLMVKLFQLDYPQLAKPNQDEYTNEVAFLLNPPANYLAPKLVLHNENQHETWLVREMLPGKLLLDKITAGEPYDNNKVLLDILNELVTLEKVGMYHNDVRAWNVLVNDEGNANLIDYGAIAKNPIDCVWPYNLFLSFQIFTLEVLERKVIAPDLIREFTFNPECLFEPFRSAFLTLFKMPQDEWSFSKLLELVNQNINSQSFKPEEPLPGMVAISIATRDAFKAYKNELSAVKVQAEAIAHQAEADAQQAETKAQQAEAHAQQANSKADQAEAQAQQAESKAKQAEAQAQQAESKAQQAEAQAQQAETKAKQAEAHAEQAERKAQQAEAHAQQAESKAQQAEAHAEQAERKAQQAEAHAEQAESKAQQAEAHAQQAESRTRSIESELLAVFGSNSWRITESLRRLGKLRIEFKNRLQGLGSNMKEISVLLVDFFKKYVRGVLAFAVLNVERSPLIKRITHKLIRKVPTLNNKLRLMLLTHRLNKIVQTPALSVVDTNEADEVRSYSKSAQIALPLPLGQRTLYIYVDHTVKCPTNTGVQRVVRFLTKSLVCSGERVRYVKWDESSEQCLLINSEEREHLAKWGGPALEEHERNLYLLPTSLQAPISLHSLSENNWLIIPEVTHITYHQQPPTLDVLLWTKRAGLKSGFIFYDAIPLRRKEFHEMSHHHALYMQQLLLADVIWPISDWSAKDLIAFWTKQESAGVKTMPEVQVMPLSGESSISERVTTQGNAEKLILSVGTIEPRKNQTKLINAFESYCKKNPDTEWRLILVGNLHPLVADEVNRATRANAAIKHLGHVSEQELANLYNKAAFTVFPSVEEGFGLPILESLWYGKPCICANFGAMAEVAEAGGCLMVDTNSIAQLEDAVAQLIDNDDLRGHLEKQAVSRPIRSWQDYAVAISSRIDLDGQPQRNFGPIYYWIDSTLQFPKNTGIQRVSRQLAKALMTLGVDLIPVKWNESDRRFCCVTVNELEYFSKWNGPTVTNWCEWIEPSSAIDKSWFLMPDLPLNRSTLEHQHLMEYVKNMGLRSAAIFYDAIPWKMRKIYPKHFAEAHKEYMLGLAGYDLVFPISDFSREDIVDFLGAMLPKPQSLDQKIKTVVLPGEFVESQRVKEFADIQKDIVKILCVGTVEPRKNHETLLKAFQLVVNQSHIEFQLIIAGRRTELDLAKLVEDFVSYNSAIFWDEEADDTRIRELYDLCDFTVYPSIEEGFGLPILESLWYAKPCICANFGAMAEVAEGGGCITVDVRDVELLATQIQRLAEDRGLLKQLTVQAITRPFKTWQDYGNEVTMRLSCATPQPHNVVLPMQNVEIEERALEMHLPKRPKLSVCISTYNRAEWLSVSLKNWARLYPEALEKVELFVCDNTSTDNTSEIIIPYLERSDFSYHRNVKNVGMLGNLRETAHRANGEYVWILGDDDLLLPGSIERVLDTINSHPQVALIYLNYAFTRIEDARTVTNIDTFFKQAIPIVPAENDLEGPIHLICARNENFFTAIYTLVFRRDHAIKAYSQDTSGRPFSSMVTCIPTTNYVLNNMMEEKGVWIGSPQVVVNMNVSWLKYAPLWILERIPEVYEQAELQGVRSEDIDRWRLHTLPGAMSYFQEIFAEDTEQNAKYFSVKRFIRRFKHLPEFKENLRKLEKIYAIAHKAGHVAASESEARVFES